jgi:hypothetical protein
MNNSKTLDNNRVSKVLKCILKEFTSHRLNLRELSKKLLLKQMLKDL